MTDAEQIAVDVKVRALVAAVDDLEASPLEDIRIEIKTIRNVLARLIKLVCRL